MRVVGAECGLSHLTNVRENKFGRISFCPPIPWVYTSHIISQSASPGSLLISWTPVDLTCFPALALYQSSNHRRTYECRPSSLEQPLYR